MKKLYFLFLLLTTSLSFSQVNYLAENFEYSDGDELITHGWLEHSSPGNSVIQVTSPGLTFTDYIGSGVGLAAGVDDNGSDVNKPFAADISAGSIYVSFMVKAGAVPYTETSTDAYFLHLGTYSTAPVLSSAFRARTFMFNGTDPNTQIQFGFSFNESSSTNGATLTGDYNIANTYLVVVKYTFIAGDNNDTVSMYIFNDGDDLSTEPAIPTIGPLVGGAADAVVLQVVALRQHSVNQNIIVDGILARTEWNLVDEGSDLSLNDFQNSELSVYPNPVNSGVVSIKSSVSGVKNVELFDIMGRSVFQTKLDTDELDVSTIRSGMYLLKISIDGRSSVTKLIIN